MSKFNYLILSIILLLGCAQAQPSDLGERVTVLFDGVWDMTAPDTLLALDPALLEISGLSTLPQGTVIAVEDESSAVYMLNPVSYTIEQKIPFSGRSDYEACYADTSGIYLLTSDHWLLSSPTLEGVQDGMRMQYWEFPVHCETEALSRYGKRWMTICKRGKTGTVFLDRSDELAVKLFKISTKELQAWLADHKPRILNKLSVNPDRWLNPSELYYDSLRGRIYILNSVSGLLLSVSPSGEIEDVVWLDGSVFKQPEALCIDSEGKLVIASEGVEGPAIIARFNRASN